MYMLGTLSAAEHTLHNGMILHNFVSGGHCFQKFNTHSLVRLTCQYPSVTTALTVWLFKAVELEVKGASPRRPTEVDLSGYKGR